MTINLLTEYSLWYAPLALLVGAIYAFWLYTQRNSWTLELNRFLAILRFVLVTWICLLLLNPFFRQITNFSEKPVVVLAIDNSQSIPLSTDSTAIRKILLELDKTKEKLIEKGYEVVTRTFSESADPAMPSAVRFDSKSTNLNGLLKNIRQTYENRNLASVLLFSDGIYNQDISPLYVPYNMTINTLAIGDTVRKPDLNVRAVFHNKIAYLGNKFPIVVEVINSGFVGSNAKIELLQNGKVLDSRNVSFSKDNLPQTLEFLATATEKGLQHFVIRLQSLDNEFTTQNNFKDIYLEVMDSREKILLLAGSPHPDIKAIRAAVEKNENYQFDWHIPTISSSEKYKDSEKYDLVIAYQIPDARGNANALLQKYQQNGTPILYVVGSSTSPTLFNASTNLVKVPNTAQIDKVIPSYNVRFERFTFDEEKKATLSKYPPLSVLFGNYQITNGTEVILYQQVGAVKTEKPLLVVKEENGKKTGAILGEGIWQWALQEYAKNEKQDTFNELINKVLQYLSSKEDKRRFRVNTSATEYMDSETVVFETETYNKIYEKIFRQKIDLVLTNEERKTFSYNYTNVSDDFRYKINGLGKGIYRYRASTILDGKTEIATGEFTVKAVELEALSTTADFGLLRQLAKQTQGQFFQSTDLEALKTHLLSKDAISILHASENIEGIMNLKWIFFILLFLASLEWFLRKFKGGY